MLGSSLCPILKKKMHVVLATDINTTEGSDFLDVTSFDQVNKYIERVKPDMIMHLAAETDVDKCEVQPDHAFLTNTIGTQNIALASQKYDIELLYVSTIGVFYGDSPSPYTEFDEPNPINIYGRSKLEGEKIVQNLLRRYYIVRAGWMIGGGPKRDKKFVAKIIHLLNEKGGLKAVTDKIGSPTFTVDFSRCVAELIETRYYGLYHCTNKGFASRFEVAKSIVELLGYGIPVEPVSSAYFPLPAARARSEVSRNYKLELLGLDNTRHWNEALKEYLEQYWKDYFKKA